MTAVEVVVPRLGTVDVADLRSWADEAPTSRPFSADIVEFAVAYGRALNGSEVAKRHPEVHALAFWLREAPLRELRVAFEATRPPEVVAAPRGTVFHVPPGNVDTVFVYSWLLAALAGNRNVVRLPSSAGDVVEGLVDVAADVLDEPRFDAVRNRTRLIRYGHEREITEACSAIADVRVIWGGDATVGALRSVPIPPHATELTFPDRFAYALLDVDAVLALDPAALDRLADRFVTDAYWFDQVACSSPRLVLWHGHSAEAADASESFFAAVARAADRARYRAPLSAVLGKLVHAADAAIVEDVTRVRQLGNDVFVLTLPTADHFRREGPGAGLFYELCVPTLAAVADLAQRRDQTVTHFGFDLADLRGLAEQCNGRGIDRLVPVGQALALHRFWDGFDLLAGFTRLTHVVPGR